MDCEELMSTDLVIVNMSSTTVGSKATYQCRDGSTDVYTTKCTSHGVWDPHPLSMDCKKTGIASYCHFYVFIISLVTCEELESTDEIFILNMSSTALGSKATYQCRTDVYTTQCTSHGVWDPHPLSSLDCTKPTEPG